MTNPLSIAHYRDKLPFFGALCVSSLMSLVLLSCRWIYSGQRAYVFLAWNLFLAWVPLFSALALWYLGQRKHHSNLLLLTLFFCWLIFFPNSPYLVTDFIHLDARHNVPLWYDLMLIFSFAWNGLILGFTSLWIVQGFIQSRFGTIVSWAIVGFTLVSSGFGIYIGRFMRWNSWDFLANPQGLALDIFDRWTNVLTHPQPLVVTILFSGFLTVAYVTVKLLAGVHWERES